MICLNPIAKSPFLASIIAFSMAMIYFALMTYSAALPPAVFISATIAAVVYILMGGQVWCQDNAEIK